jgi:glutathione S-transferase
MSIGANALILHHHDISYNSERARVVLGMKDAEWFSVIQPIISPKPEFTRLTGGYQRVPALQIGSDVYCDSKLVMAELERRVPDPSVLGGLDFAIAAWVDSCFTPATFAVGIPEMADQMAPQFIRDRQEIYGPSFDLEAMKAASTVMGAQWRAQAAWLEQALARSDGPFLQGVRPTIADATAFIPLWFFDQRAFMAAAVAKPAERAETPPTPPAQRDPTDPLEALMHGFDRLKEWRERIIGFGHGRRARATYQDAFEIARASEPDPSPPHDRNDPLRIDAGTTVTVTADDSTRDPITATLVALTPEQIVLAREDSILGRLHVHFPRAGYFVEAADSAAAEPATAAAATANA